MFPNTKYFELYNLSPVFADTKVYNFGFAYLVRKCAEDLGLLDCMTVVFGDRVLDILVVAAYIMHEGSAMDGIDDWLERTYFKGFDKNWTSQSTNRVFSKISQTQMHKFFREWVKKVACG